MKLVPDGVGGGSVALSADEVAQLAALAPAPDPPAPAPAPAPEPTPAPTPAPDPAPAGEITSAADLVAKAKDPTLVPRTYLVRGGDYGYPTLAPKGPLVLKAYPGEHPTFSGVSLGSAVTLQGLSILGFVSLPAAASGSQLLGNQFLVKEGALDIKPGLQLVLVEGNTFAQAPGGVKVLNLINAGGTNTVAAVTDLTIRGNKIGPWATGGDAIQAHNTVRLTLEGNEIFGVSRPSTSLAHPDCFQHIYGSEGLVVRHNFLHDNAAQGIFVQLYLAENQNATVEDNLVVRQIGSYQAILLNIRTGKVVHNTTDGVIDGATTGALRENNVAANAIDSAAEDYNLAGRFVKAKGAHSIVGVPKFRDAAHNDYRLVAGSPGTSAAHDGTDMGVSWVPA